MKGQVMNTHDGWLTYDGGASGVALAVRFDRYDGDRCQYEYLVSDGETVLAAGDDLRSGSGAEIDLFDTMRSLVSFLGAAVESYEYEQRTGRPGENSDLFSRELLELLASTDAIGMVESDLGCYSDA
jgi:hypothetical protein